MRVMMRGQGCMLMCMEGTMSERVAAEIHVHVHGSHDERAEVHAHVHG